MANKQMPTSEYTTDVLNSVMHANEITLNKMVSDNNNVLTDDVVLAMRAEIAHNALNLMHSQNYRTSIKFCSYIDIYASDTGDHWGLSTNIDGYLKHLHEREAKRIEFKKTYKKYNKAELALPYAYCHHLEQFVVSWERRKKFDNGDDCPICDDECHVHRGYHRGDLK